jgi:DNA processing protein
MISRQTESIIVASQLRGVGPVALRQLAYRLESEPNADLRDILKDGIGRAGKPSSHDVDTAEAAAAGSIDDCRRHEITILSLLDARYPFRLRDIKDAPPVMFLKGDMDALEPLSIAVVGTRDASKTGAELAHRVAVTVASGGFCVTSGLALGIDSAAHRGAIAAQGRTITVLAHGLDQISPSSNSSLAHEILENGGLWLSEHAPGVPPRPHEYVRRNRIQSGLSIASIIVESGPSGGSIHQATFTAEQERALFVLRPDGHHPDFNEEGGRMLEGELGARVLRSADDLEHALAGLSTSPASRDSDRSVPGTQLEFGW